MNNVAFDVSHAFALPGISMADRINGLTATMMHTHGRAYCNISLHHEVEYSDTPFRKMGGDFTRLFEECFGVNPEAFLSFGNDVMVMHHVGTENGKNNNHVIVAEVTGKEMVNLMGERLTDYKVKFYVIVPMEDIGLYEVKNAHFILD